MLARNSVQVVFSKQIPKSLIFIFSSMTVFEGLYIFQFEKNSSYLFACLFS